MNKQEKILRFLKLMYPESWLKSRMETLKLDLLLFGRMTAVQSTVVDDLQENSAKVAEELYQKYLPVYDRFYSEEHIDTLYEFYSSEACKHNLEIIKRLDLELGSADIAWANEIVAKSFEKINSQNLK